MPEVQVAARRRVPSGHGWEEVSARCCVPAALTAKAGPKRAWSLRNFLLEKFVLLQLYDYIVPP